jgi:hypothetical protein
MSWWWLVIGVAVGLAALAVLAGLAWRPLRGLAREAEVQHARRLFTGQREHLEAHFLSAAAATGKPRGLRWKGCEWESQFELARERTTGRLAALVGVTIQFEAVPGSDMEGLPAVGNLRNASAVFFFDRGRWHTVGKAVFNMNPDEAIAHYHYERVEAG